MPIYQSLGVEEVWQWRAGTFTFYRLEADGFREVERSVLVPELKPADAGELVNVAERQGLDVAAEALRKLVAS